MAQSKGLLKGKVVVIIGASGLLGREYVKAVVTQGGKVIAADIKKPAAAAHVMPVQLDITSELSVRQMIAAGKKRFGRIDAVVNSSFPRDKRWGAKLEDVRYEDFCESLCSHLGGYFLVSKEMALFFKKQGHGNIITMGSMYATAVPRFWIYEGTGMTSPVAYAAIKAGVVQMTKYMARYFKGWNVRINSISPGGILDGQHKDFLKRYRFFGNSTGMLDRKDVNGALIFLLSDMSRHVNGQNLMVDDGWTL